MQASAARGEGEVPVGWVPLRPVRMYSWPLVINTDGVVFFTYESQWMSSEMMTGLDANGALCACLRF